jgi:hypothetical protein
MSFAQRAPRRPPPARVGDSILAVGRCAYVAQSGVGAGYVTMTDDAGRDSRESLPDGTAVEILAWRPRGSAGTRYLVRSACDGVEGWLAATNLRSSLHPVAPPPPAAPQASPAPARAVQLEAAGRRFGQR